MRQPDFNYRPNPQRAIYIASSFNEDLAADLLPKIQEARVSTEPLSVFINSRGGSINILETIHGALCCRDVDGRRNRVITVALGQAGSAAATLLVMGDYAIAYPYSTIHFHGARLSDIDVMTMEHASNYAAQLARMNQSNALRMAKRVIARQVRRFVQLYPDIKAEAGEKEISLEDYTRHLKLRTTGIGDRVITRTINKITRASDLSEKVLKRAKFKDDDSGLKQDAAVLKALIDYEVKQHKADGFRLTDETIVDVLSSYSLIRDFELGDHFKSLDPIVRAHGPELLDEKQREEFQNLVSQKGNVIDWLYEKIGYTLSLLWHFSVILCRELQSGENRLRAEDAYWLGCVDEVVGTSLLGRRADAEVEIPSLQPVKTQEAQ